MTRLESWIFVVIWIIIFCCDGFVLHDDLRFYVTFSSTEKYAFLILVLIKRFQLFVICSSLFIQVSIFSIKCEEYLIVFPNSW